MKTHILAGIAMLATSIGAFAHGDIEIGPKGGRLLELGTKNPVHLEVVLQGDKFLVSLYDEAAKKSVPVSGKTLSVTTGDRNKPQKIEVETAEEGFSFAKPASDDVWLILQLKETGGKAQTARLHYEAAICGECKKAEWLCACGGDDKAKKK